MVRTAGLNLTYIIRNNLPGRTVICYPLSGKTDSQGRAIMSESDLIDYLRVNNNIKWFTGHQLRLFEGRYSSLPNAKYMTFFRNPIDRYLSHFQQWNLKHESSESIERRINDKKENNYMVRFLADTEDLEKAKSVIDQNLDFIGFAEKFDISLLLMKQYLNLDDKFDLRYAMIKHMTGKTPGRNYLDNKFSYLPQDYKEKIIQNNTLDIELYEYAKIRFNKQIANYKGSLKSDFIKLKKNSKNFKFHRYQVYLWRLDFLLRYKIRLEPSFLQCSCSRIRLKHSNKCKVCEADFG
tara:strand:+ start:33466 stop:34347 length:882 start_codon:yes stop_codon:yes gene_type:complete